MRAFGLMRKLMVVGALLLAPVASFAGIFISVGIAPPALPVYTQPPCPGDGYLWTPGYWHYGPAGYYWVPGVWVRPPQVGYLWTPGYWGWGGSAFIFHEGYWGPHIGFYGGVNYGFGYGGSGFEGGYWNHGVFAYNRTVNNINVTNVHNVYSRTVIVNNVTVNRVSYNGGNGGLQARPSVQEQAAIREQHAAPTGEQQTHLQAARADRTQLASVNGGRPQLAAARTANEYHAVAQQHAASQPITERDRAARQQQRIGNGVKSGQLTARETSNLENRAASINHQAAADRAANGGRLTQQEHQQINQRQNNLSQSISNDKHNPATDRAVQQRQEAAPRAQSENRPAQGGGHGEGPGHPRQP
jgi:WXXGXW repeat (2 copies)